MGTKAPMDIPTDIKTPYIKLYFPTISQARILAQLSASSTSDASNPEVDWCSDNTCSTTRNMSVNQILSSRKALTATSSAALNTAG